MTGVASGPSQARPEARLFRDWALLGGALALAPVARAWQLTADLDSTVTTLALFAGAAWQINSLLRRVAQRPSPATRKFALVLLALGLWQVGWIGAEDFWFFRIAFIQWAAVWLLLAWGVAGLIWGWRVLAAFTLWAAFCDSPWQWSRDAYQTGDRIGPWLSQLTAQVSAWLLWQMGAPVAVKGRVIELSGRAVSVGIPCTALPLVKLLLLLLGLATLLLSLRLSAVLRLAVITVLASFVISVGRVMLLAEVVRDPALFHYWHDPDGGGGSWFTALGMLFLAFLIARQIFGRKPAVAATNAPVPAAPLGAAWIALAGVAALTIGQLSAIRPAAKLPAPPKGEGFQIHIERSAEVPDHPEPDKAAWVRHWIYSPAVGRRSMEVVLAYFPRMLTGDPLGHPALEKTIPVHGRWQLSPGNGYATCSSPAGSAWTATIPARGPSVADSPGWDRYLHQALVRPSRWLEWFAHLAPLRDKRAYWLAVYEKDGTSSPPSAAPSLFNDWVAVLTHSS